MTTARWAEALEATSRWGMQVVFNLNLLHGRFEDYSNPKKPAGRGLDGDKTLPPWDHSEAQALMEWTVKNVKQELWPAAFGLGNELNGYISPEIWASDVITMKNLIKKTFGKAAAVAGGKVPHPQASHLKVLTLRMLSSIYP